MWRVYGRDHFLTPNVTFSGFVTTSDTKCDVLRYWRRRSDCYFVLFTTSLVVITITFTMCALHFRVDSLSWLVL
jgi:hypothetical protein